MRVVIVVGEAGLVRAVVARLTLFTTHQCWLSRLQNFHMGILWGVGHRGGGVPRKVWDGQQDVNYQPSNGRTGARDSGDDPGGSGSRLAWHDDGPGCGDAAWRLHCVWLYMAVPRIPWAREKTLGLLSFPALGAQNIKKGEKFSFLAFDSCAKCYKV